MKVVPIDYSINYCMFSCNCFNSLKMLWALMSTHFSSRASLVIGNFNYFCPLLAFDS